LNEFNFECIGSTQTDDEQVIADSLKQFGKLISAIEDERDNMVSFPRFSGVFTTQT
jgi:Rho GTPase-activating protein 26